VGFDNNWGAAAFMGVSALATIFFALWLAVAPLIMTIQLARINRKLKEMLDRGAAGMPPQV
jgi:hypothetical protein